MLVLTRKRGESIEIGKDILVHLLEIGGSRATIGIDAPLEIDITRSELPLRKRRPRRTSK